MLELLGGAGGAVDAAGGGNDGYPLGSGEPLRRAVQASIHPKRRGPGPRLVGNVRSFALFEIAGLSELRT